MALNTKAIATHILILGTGLLAYELKLEWLILILATTYGVTAILFILGVLQVYLNIHKVPVGSVKEYALKLKEQCTNYNNNLIHLICVLHIVVANIMAQLVPYTLYCGILFALTLVFYRFFLYSIFKKYLEE